MEELAWLMLVAAPLILSASLSLLFRRAWQRVLFSGLASAFLYAAALYAMQSDMIAQTAGATLPPHMPPARVAMEVALVMLPIGLITGYFFHLSTRFLGRTQA